MPKDSMDKNMPFGENYCDENTRIRRFSTFYPFKFVLFWVFLPFRASADTHPDINPHLPHRQYGLDQLPTQ